MSPESGHLLELFGIRAAYGRIEVLHGVDLAVPHGSVVALLGPNGAGKSTLLKVASGQLQPAAGCVHVAGEHVNGATSDDLARIGVCAVPEGRGVFPNLTVRENLLMVTFTGADEQTIMDRVFGSFPRLKDRADQLAGTMSGGEQQMLALARAVATDPTLLMLDEISMGLAPRIVAELYDLVAAVAAAGTAILLVEQYARTALRIADYAAVLSQGRIVAVGQPADVADALQSAYLGGAA